MRRHYSRVVTMLSESSLSWAPFSNCVLRHYYSCSQLCANKEHKFNCNTKSNVWPSVYLEQHRHINWKAKMQKMFEFRITEEHANPMRSSNVAEVGFDYMAKGHDPVWNYETYKKVNKSMDKTPMSSLDDYLDKQESAKWMNVKTAAAILGIKEAELPTLTHEQLTEKWESAYRQNRSTRREEIMLAAEELLAYLDSALHEKKNKAHYRSVIQSIRTEMDAEVRAKREFWLHNGIWISCVAFCAGTVLFVVVGLSLRLFSLEHVRKKAQEMKTAVYTELFVPDNVEPPPDYSTRYFTTPSALEIDQRAGRLEKERAFADSQTVTMMEQKDAFDKKEEMEILKLLNDVNEQRAREAHAQEVADSRVQVLLPSEVAANKNTASDDKKANSVVNETFQERYRKAKASVFGDPDFQINTGKNVQKAKALDEVQRRMQELEKWLR